MTIVMAAFWTLMFVVDTWAPATFTHDGEAMIAMGEISLPLTPGTLGLASNTAAPGSLTLGPVQGTLRARLSSADPALASALRWSLVPSILALVVFSFLLFSALRTVCANLERGEVFSESNLRLVRWIGAGLIAYSLVAGAGDLWASYLLGGYFREHVSLTGLGSVISFHEPGFVVPFLNRPAGLLTMPGGVLVGCLVLLVAEAFRQGLQLKTENDLTI